MARMRIDTIRQTCQAAPSQWAGRLTDGRPFYIRYRWGRLTVAIGAENAPIETAVNAPEWFDGAIGADTCSFITLDDVCAATGLEIQRARPAPPKHSP